MTRTFVFSALIAGFVATGAMAAGSDSDGPPTETDTTRKCASGEIFDLKTKKCKKVEAHNFSDDAIYEAAREVAYAGQYDRAMDLLNAAANQSDPRILNYKGFVHRKQGDTEKAMKFYQAALAIDPDYILARSYMGQGLAKEGKIGAARKQLWEIERRGGRESWAYVALADALRGSYHNY